MKRLAILVVGLVATVALAVRAFAQGEEAEVLPNNTCATPDPGEPEICLTWAPPTLVNPRIVNVPANDTSIGNGVTKIILSDTANGGAGEDAIINMPATKKVGGVWIQGGRNVRLIGGYLSPNPDHSTTPGGNGTRGFYVKNNRGTVHIEGTLMDASAGGEFDAMEADSGNSTIQLENNRWLGVNGTFGTVHGDCFMSFNTNLTELRVDRMTVTTNYQCLQLYDRYNSTVKNVNMSASGVPHSDGTVSEFFVWVGNDNCVHKHSTSFSEVYVQPESPQTLGTSVWPKSTDANCPASVSNNFLTWPEFTTISGGIKGGVPASGDFVPSGSAGLNYVSPGYR